MFDVRIKLLLNCIRGTDILARLDYGQLDVSVSEWIHIDDLVQRPCTNEFYVGTGVHLVTSDAADEVGD